MVEGDARGRSLLRLAVVGIVMATVAVGAPASLAGSGDLGAGVRAASAQEPHDAAGWPEFVPGEVLVKLKRDAPADALEKLNRANNARVSDCVPGTRLALVELPPGLTVAEAVKRYAGNPSVDYAEPNLLVEPAANEPNDPRYTNGAMWTAKNTGQVYRTVDGVGVSGTPDADLDLPEAWDITTGSPNVQVTVIDTGANLANPELNGNVWTNPDEVAGNGVDDDNNGYVDDMHGWDFVSNDNMNYDDPTGDKHGALVSSTLAAVGNNSTEIAGVTWNSQLVSLKFIDAADVGTSANAVKAMRYAADEGFEITNNSWTHSGYSQSLYDAIAYANTKGTVAAAGNGGPGSASIYDRTGINLDEAPRYPAACDLPNVVAVARPTATT